MERGVCMKKKLTLFESDKNQISHTILNTVLMKK